MYFLSIKLSLFLLASATCGLGVNAEICGDNVDADMSIMETFNPWLIRTIGYECVNNTHFIGDEEYCASPLGNVGLVHGTYVCADGSVCFQCGDSGSGAAVCSNPDEPPEGCFQEDSHDSPFGAVQFVQAVQGFNGSQPTGSGYCGLLSADSAVVCDPNATMCISDFDCGATLNFTSCLWECGPQIGSSTNESSSGCLVGDIMFSPGQLVGSIGFLCYNNTMVGGQESFCGRNGTIAVKDSNFTCPQEAPYCFQCGEAAYGAAICLSNASATNDGCIIGGSNALSQSNETISDALSQSNETVASNNNFESSNQNLTISGNSNGSEDTGGSAAATISAAYSTIYLRLSFCIPLLVSTCIFLR